ncbi:camp-binding domain-like protein [Coccomyxa subellipsoidea C-169]|uniref:Camp-binding domain-like protein n=1 Tax=Coccomyxa subellipsoidea (strain C-169) TaxID=574566 RepID=I0YIE2_COCSC|nr:camp-binding domain-like protein [Coccomyxa subellipsoidea C-169]EIE18161.1 camp-binding domain-like protein [Coccomyxa subellipsoidea C-169]|eukprot:XP_005642705.1 camp-binding domain-like protein [Coccomyxa subellipsoidea C-169]
MVVIIIIILKPHGLADQSIYEKYSWAVLKAWSETVSAGYGAQDPVTAFDCWMTTASLFWGMCIWTFLGGIVTTLLIHLNAASSEYTAKITALNQYMAHRRLPQVCLYTCGDLIASVPFFEDAEEGFTTSLVTLLRPAVYLRDDVVIREGEVSREMYFIKSGAAQASTSSGPVEVNGMVVTVLKKGSYFGEIGLLRNCRRTASIRALSQTCDLFVLSKENFDGVMKDYPDSRRAMDLIAEHRLRTLHSSSAWQFKQDALGAKSVSLGAKIESVLEMDDIEGGDSGQQPPTPTRIQATISSSSAPVPGITRGNSRAASGGRSAPATPYTLQRTMTADLARQQFAETPSRVHPLRHASSATSEAALAQQGHGMLRRTASAGDLSMLSLQQGDADRRARSAAAEGSNARERGGAGVLGKLMGKVGGAGRQAARRNDFKAFLGPPGGRSVPDQAPTPLRLN